MKAIKNKPSPFVEVIKSSEVVRFKPAVERSMERSLQGIDVKTFNSKEEFFKDLGIKC